MCERERILFKLQDLYTEIAKLRHDFENIPAQDVSILRNRINATQKLVQDFYAMVSEVRALATGLSEEVSKTDEKVEDKFSEFVAELKKQSKT